MSKSINKFIPKKKSIYKNKRCFKHEKEISSRKFTIIFLEFFFLMIFYNLISLTEEKSLGIRKLDTSSIVTMIIEGSGTKKVLGNGFAFSPNEVYINNENKALESSNEYLLGNGKNNLGKMLMKLRDELGSSNTKKVVNKVINKVKSII